MTGGDMGGPPMSEIRRSVLIIPRRQGCDNGLERVLGHGGHLAVGAVLDRVGDVDDRRGDAQRAGLSHGRLAERLGGDHHRREPA